MMNAEYFAHLYEYDHFENRTVLNILRQLSLAATQTHSLLAHLLQAKKIWMWRMRGKNYQRLDIWPELSLEECEQLIDQNGKDWSDFLEVLTDDDLLREVVFEDSKGVEYRMPTRDILTHVLMHGAYHRGQIASAVRSAGSEPVNTDYIRYAALSNRS